MNKEAILKRLMAGEDPTVIGNELVAMLNQAMEEKKQADEAKRKEEEAKAWQIKDAEVLAEVMNDYFKKYCGATADMVTAEGLVKAAPDLAKMLKVVDKIEDSVNEIKATVKETTKVPGKKAETKVLTGKEAEDWIANVFTDFFNAFGL